MRSTLSGYSSVLQHIDQYHFLQEVSPTEVVLTLLSKVKSVVNYLSREALVRS